MHPYFVSHLAAEHVCELRAQAAAARRARRVRRARRAWGIIVPADRPATSCRDVIARPA
jgi:hypothetical protein